eukprot:5759848-Amphidinium_carterae.1
MELHEGVLYYMELKEIEDVMKKAREDDEEANRMLEIHQMDMNILETKIWKQLEDRDGKIDDNEDYITACRDRDEEKMKKICYKYFEGHKSHNELRRQWKQKIDEDLRKENTIGKALQREEEEERQNKKREPSERGSTAASSTPKAKPTTLPTQAAAAAAITEHDLREHRQYRRVNKWRIRCSTRRSQQHRQYQYSVRAYDWKDRTSR